MPVRCRLHQRRVRTGRAARRGPCLGPAVSCSYPSRPCSKILVSAPVEEFASIEETIKLLDVGASAIEIVYDFIDVQGENAFEIEGLIKPMLENKLSQFISEGTISESEVGGGKGRAAQGVLTLQAGPREAIRLIIAAPQLLVAEAKALVAAIDRPAADEDEAGNPHHYPDQGRPPKR